MLFDRHTQTLLKKEKDKARRAQAMTEYNEKKWLAYCDDLDLSGGTPLDDLLEAWGSGEARREMCVKVERFVLGSIAREPQSFQDRLERSILRTIAFNYGMEEFWDNRCRTDAERCRFLCSLVRPTACWNDKCKEATSSDCYDFDALSAVFASVRECASDFELVCRDKANREIGLRDKWSGETVYIELLGQRHPTAPRLHS